MIGHTAPRVSSRSSNPQSVRSLPRFPLADAARTDDSGDVLATAPRAAWRPASRPRIRKTSPSIPVVIRPEGTEEIEAQQILLEVWADPPPETMRTPEAAKPYPAPQRFSLPDIDKVDLMLRDSLDHHHEVPSVAPVAIAIHEPDVPIHVDVEFPPSLEQAVPDYTPQRTSGIAAIAIACVVGLAAAAAGAAIAVHTDALARARSVATTSRLHVSAASRPATASTPSTVVVAPTPPPPAPVPTAANETNVSALPAVTIPPKMTLLTLPASAAGHRVFFDGRILDTSKEPLLVKCGGHYVRVGSTGRAHSRRLPCGGAFILE